MARRNKRASMREGPLSDLFKSTSEDAPIDPPEALKLVKKYYGAIPRSSQPIPAVYTQEPPQTGPRGWR